MRAGSPACRSRPRVAAIASSRVPALAGAGDPRAARTRAAAARHDPGRGRPEGRRAAHGGGARGRAEPERDDGRRRGQRGAGTDRGRGRWPPPLGRSAAAVAARDGLRLAAPARPDPVQRPRTVASAARPVPAPADGLGGRPGRGRRAGRPVARDVGRLAAGARSAAPASTAAGPSTTAATSTSMPAVSRRWAAAGSGCSGASSDAGRGGPTRSSPSTMPTPGSWPASSGSRSHRSSATRPRRYDRPTPPPDRIRQRLGLPSSTAVVLYQGGLMSDRGIEQSMEAILAVPECGARADGLRLARGRDPPPRRDRRATPSASGSSARPTRPSSSTGPRRPTSWSWPSSRRR